VKIHILVDNGLVTNIFEVKLGALRRMATRKSEGGSRDRGSAAKAYFLFQVFYKCSRRRYDTNVGYRVIGYDGHWSWVGAVLVVATAVLSLKTRTFPKTFQFQKGQCLKINIGLS
jgi:hypothetical protein